MGLLTDLSNPKKKKKEAMVSSRFVDYELNLTKLVSYKFSTTEHWGPKLP